MGFAADAVFYGAVSTATTIWSRQANGVKCNKTPREPGDSRQGWPPPFSSTGREIADFRRRAGDALKVSSRTAPFLAFTGSHHIGSGSVQGLARPLRSFSGARAGSSEAESASRASLWTWPHKWLKFHWFVCLFSFLLKP